MCLPLAPITASLKTLFSIHHYRMEQIRFEYSLFPSLANFQKTNPRIYKTSIYKTNSIFNVPNSLRLTYLTRLRVGLSHFREHKFR